MDFKKISNAVSEPFPDNLRLLQELFPSVVKDGEVDFDALRAELGEYVEVEKEHYELNWAGKQDAKQLVGHPLVGKTLKYVAEESKNPETTENLYIEGDNLEALKLLHNSYRGKIKMIYIDPPYNTGKKSDFVFVDRYYLSKIESDIAEGVRSEEEGRLVLNPDTSARYHANWLSMMYPRLRLARDLLTDDGVIFISIDDNEVDDLKQICDEIFGEFNFVGCAGRITKKANNQDDYWAPNFDYLLTYTKNKNMCPPFLGGANHSSYDHVEEEGPRKGERYQLVRLYMSNLDPMRGCSNQRYYIECPDGTFIIPPGENFPTEAKDGAFVVPQSGKDKIWRWTYQSYLERKDQIVLKQGRSSNVVGVEGAETKWNAFTKTYLNDVLEKSTATPNSFIENHINQNATHELKKLDIPFTSAKPSSLMKYLADICQVNSGDIVLDFFSGSASTADAVMQLNAEKGITASFIMVQIEEKCNEKTDAHNAGYMNICEIGKERIRRAGEKIKAENPLAELDVGFKVFKVDDTNIRWLAAEAGKQGVTLEDALTAGGKDLRDFMNGTNDLDVVYEILIRQYGIPLTAPIDLLSDIGERTYSIADTVIVCLEEDVTDAVVDKIANLEPIPQKIVFRDSAFGDNISLKENAMLRLDALMQKHAVGGRQPYSVEFL